MLWKCMAKFKFCPNATIVYLLGSSLSSIRSSSPKTSVLLHSRIAFFASRTNTNQSLETLTLVKPARASHISFLPLIILNLITCLDFFILSLLFSIPNTISTGAKFGEYWGRSHIRKPNFLVICFVTVDKCMDALSKINSDSEAEKSIQSSMYFASSIIKFQKTSELVVLLLMNQSQSPFEMSANKTTALPVPHVLTIGWLSPTGSQE